MNTELRKTIAQQIGELLLSNYELAAEVQRLAAQLQPPQSQAVRPKEPDQDGLIFPKTHQQNGE